MIRGSGATSRIRDRAFDDYNMHQEIDYLLKLLGFPIIREVVFRYVTVEKWTTLKNLYLKASALWLIAIFTRAKEYYDTLGLEKMKTSIQETFHKLHGVIYAIHDNQDVAYDRQMADCDYTCEQVYRGICVSRARRDLNTPVRDVGELKTICGTS